MLDKEQDQTPQEPLDTCDCESVGVYHRKTLHGLQNGSQRLPAWLERSLVRDETGRILHD